MKSTRAAGGELLPIGEVARIFGVRTSALRYYDARGLVRPADRSAGRRRYGAAELRRLAFIETAQQLGMSLDDIGVILDGSGEEWRAVVRRHIAALEEQIAQARRAAVILTHALACPSERPVEDCPHLRPALDERVRRGMT